MTIWKSSPQLDSVFPLLETQLLLYFYWPKSILSPEPSILLFSVEQNANLSLVWKAFFYFWEKHEFVATTGLSILNNDELVLKTLLFPQTLTLLFFGTIFWTEIFILSSPLQQQNI